MKPRPLSERNYATAKRMVTLLDQMAGLEVVLLILCTLALLLLLGRYA
jgi:hypothetical protein